VVKGIFNFQVIRSIIGLTLLGFYSPLVAQVYPERTTQQIAIGPYVGYESSAEAAVYGFDATYEFRPFRRWGFTAAATYDRSPFTAFTPGSPQAMQFEKTRLGIPETVSDIALKQGRLALTGGARFYIKRFFIAGGIGWTTADYTWKDKEGGDMGSGDAQQSYHYYGVGYQLHLAGAQRLEFYFNASTGGVPQANGTSKVVVGARYGLAWD